MIACVVGGAIGDAWGGPYEGRPGPFTAAFPDDPRLSDDTQLTLATCESIIERHEVDPEGIAMRFVDWFRRRRLRGLGSSTLKALRDLDQGGHWALSGAKGTFAAGNGAAMRAAPLAFFLDPQSSEDRRTLRDVCRITHHNDEAYAGALAVVAAIREAVNGRVYTRSGDFLEQLSSSLPDCAVRDRLLELASVGSLPIPEVAARFGTSGHVIESVPLAILCAQTIGTSTFDDCVRAAVEVGGDTDTIASMTGQIAGAIVGLEGVPIRRLLQSQGGETCLATARRLGDTVMHYGLT